MSKTSNLIVGFLSGAAIGLLAGILTAPDKGENTRAKIKNKVTDFANDISDNVEDKINQLGEQIEQLKKEAQEKINDIKGTTDKNKKQV